MLACKLRLTAQTNTWEKYTTSVTYSNPGSFAYYNTCQWTLNEYGGYTSYSFNLGGNIAAGFQTAGSYTSFPNAVGQTVYVGGAGSYIEQYVVASYSAPNYTVTVNQAWCTSNNSQGSYVGTVTSSNPNAYPTNGYNSSDGYWYVKQ